MDVAIERPANGMLNRRDAVFMLLIACATFLAYQPAWQGGWLWDENECITKPELQSLQGLGRIWADGTATSQYYPLVTSFFWFEHRVWGETTTGYHLINIALHTLAATLVLIILRHLQVPGALLAAGIFALHPLQVESVAWVAELKNTLSAVFYLSAMLSYLHFDDSREKRYYASSLMLFSLGLLCKTVTATLPAALLVIFWWRRGKLSWRNDALPLIPLFTLGACAGVLTAWLERSRVGAEGSDFDFTAVQRLLMAGRVAWFYAGKLLWPAHLMFMYPRWEISATALWQYAFPVAALGLLAVAWTLRHNTRAPLAALLFFGGTLFPVMGFLNVYPFRFSLVANHFQYLACLGLITLAAAGASLAISNSKPWSNRLRVGLGAALLAVLAGLTWRESRVFADIDTLYRTTLDRNPSCWLVEGNLGGLLLLRGNFAEGIPHLQKAVELNPNHAEAHSNLCAALTEENKLDEAIAHAYKALEIHPDFADAHNLLANALARQGKIDEAKSHYEASLKFKPQNTSAYNNLAAMLMGEGDLDAAVAALEKALQIDPSNALAHNNLGNVLVEQGKFDQAVASFEQAVNLKPDYIAALCNLAAAQAQRGNNQEAINSLRQAIKLQPGHADAHLRLANLFNSQGEKAQAVVHWREAARLAPNHLELAMRLAWLLSTSPDESIRNGPEALGLAERAVELCSGQLPESLDALAAAYAETGQFSLAIQTAAQALNLAAAQNKPRLVAVIRLRISRYQSHLPYRDPGSR